MGNMKKLIASMLLVVIILNFIFLNKQVQLEKARREGLNSK